MPDQQCNIRYSEKSCAGGISSENIFWFWDDKVEIFQNLTIGEFEHKVNVAFDKVSAVRYAKMILERYGSKDICEIKINVDTSEVKTAITEIDALAKMVSACKLDGFFGDLG